MLNGLILAVFALLVILVAIKYGLLQVLAITLSVIALIPFGTSVYLSFTNKPEIRYQLELMVDTRIDPAKLGFFAIFQPGYAYRFITKIDADFVNLDRQEGEMKPAY